MTQLPTWREDPAPDSAQPAAGLSSPGQKRHDQRPEQPQRNDVVPTPRQEAPPSAHRAPRVAERGAPGMIIGERYTLRTAIGHGGMGTVWRASDTVLRRDVAVKEVLLPSGMADSDREQMYKRTLREARAAAALSHPAVVQVYDVVTDGGRPWIVMELLTSRTLAEMIVEDGPLAPRAVAKIGLALLGALEVAHAAGVLHRDVKPANVLICPDGRCVLTDFGVARMPTDSQLTTPGMVLGSPHFISPERAIGAKFGPPSDLFSLGVTLYTAVEGQPPFDKRDPFETMRAVVEEPPTPALRAGPLDRVLLGLLEKDPDRRWDVQTTRGVLRELLAGPLASSASIHVTDPYAVIRPTPVGPPPPEATHPGGQQVGGRAMLAPGESVSSAIRRRKPGAMGGTGELPNAQRSETKRGDGKATDPADVPTGAYSPMEKPGSGAARSTSAGAQPGGRSGLTGATQPMAIPGAGTYGKPKPRKDEPAQYPGHRGDSRGSAGAYSSAWRNKPHQRMIRAFHGAPRKVQLAIMGSAAALVLLVLLLAVLPSSEPVARSENSPSAPAASLTPSAKAQEYHDDRGFRVNVPSGWTQSPGSTYVDFVDPNDHSRKIRLNIEKAGGTAKQFFDVAEGQLKKKGSTSCPAPYKRLGLRDDVAIDKQPAVELEYTCGEGDQMRHGLWRAFVLNGNAYQFFVSVSDARFAESKSIYDELVRSYHLSA